MNRNASLIFPRHLHEVLSRHLFPGDGEEHAAAIAAGFVQSAQGPRLLVRDVFVADEPKDYRIGSRGYKALQPQFIHRCVTYCRDRRLVYLAVHNHGGFGSVAFSRVDLQSHERGYPALLDIAQGMPVGAIVAARGAMEVDLWLPNGSRCSLREALILGPRIQRVYASQSASQNAGEIDIDGIHGRQSLFLGRVGQERLKQSRIAIVGLGGIGSLVNEYLARLGVGELVLVDMDDIEMSNLSRVVGARHTDIAQGEVLGARKIDIAARVAREANPTIRIRLVNGDFAVDCVAREVLDCDFIFLAADSMRARLVFNAVVHQYYIPGMQLGTKIRVASDGGIEAAFGVVRNVTPGEGCLVCNQLIDPGRLSEEWKTDEERKSQQYGTQLPNPSVISMNAVSAAHAVNEFLFSYLGLGTPQGITPYRRFDHLKLTTIQEQPRKSPTCTECSNIGTSRLARADTFPLPCAQQTSTTG